MILNHKPEIYYLDGPDIPEDAGQIRCDDCEGTGEWRDGKCQMCHGFGVYYVDRKTFNRLDYNRQQKRCLQHLMTGEEAAACIRVIAAIERQICLAFQDGRRADALSMSHLVGRLIYQQTGQLVGELKVLF